MIRKGKSLSAMPPWGERLPNPVGLGLPSLLNTDCRLDWVRQQKSIQHRVARFPINDQIVQKNVKPLNQTTRVGVDVKLLHYLSILQRLYQQKTTQPRPLSPFFRMTLSFVIVSRP